MGRGYPSQPSRGIGERRKLPQRGPGWSPGWKQLILIFSRNRRPLVAIFVFIVNDVVYFVAWCLLVKSRWVQRYRQTDGRTDGSQTVTLRYLRDAANVKMRWHICFHVFVVSMVHGCACVTFRQVLVRFYHLPSVCSTCTAAGSMHSRYNSRQHTLRLRHYPFRLQASACASFGFSYYWKNRILAT